MEIAGFEIPSESPVFISILAVHIPVALVAVVTGAVAMLRQKRRGAHTIFGSIYFWSLGALFATSAAFDFDNPVWPTSMLTFGPPLFR